MLITLADFIGELPAKHPRTLPKSAAQVASNTRLDDGVITPFSASTFVTDLATPRTALYLQGASWLAWDTDVDAVPGPTANERLYVTGDGVPKMWVDDTWFTLALPAPATAPTIALVGTLDTDLTEETITYAYTYVTSYGEESAPSPLAASIQWTEGLPVSIHSIANAPANRGVTAIRLYRSETTALGETDLFFVAEVPGNMEAPSHWQYFQHDLDTAPLNEPIPTVGHDTPVDKLHGIIAMPNGMLVAFNGRELHFCEPYQPHSWPSKYSLTVDYDIVGLAAFGANLAVLTKGTPYRGQGYHPDEFSLDKIEENLPCVSKRGIVDLGYAAAYPSTEGLVLVSSTGAQLVTKGMFTRRDWAKLQPDTFVATNYAGRYLFGFDGDLIGATEKTGIIDLSGANPFFMRADQRIKAAYHDLRTGKVYVQDDTHNLYVLDDVTGTSFASLKWRSKVFDFPYQTGFAVMLAEGKTLDASSNLEIDVIADGVVILTITGLNTPERLPAIKANTWEIEVRGKVQIESIALATSMRELAQRP